MKLSDWYQISVDEVGVELDVQPPGGAAWSAQIAWDSIERVCFEAADWHSSDTIYLFVRGRDASYMIPTQGAGSADLWGKLVGRGLFDGELAIEAATATEGQFWWPPLDQSS